MDCTSPRRAAGSSIEKYSIQDKFGAILPQYFLSANLNRAVKATECPSSYTSKMIIWSIYRVLHKVLGCANCWFAYKWVCIVLDSRTSTERNTIVEIAHRGMLQKQRDMMSSGHTWGEMILSVCLRWAAISAVSATPKFPFCVLDWRPLFRIGSKDTPHQDLSWVFSISSKKDSRGFLQRRSPRVEEVLTTLFSWCRYQ